jgi:putative hydrolase of the HAD superfamily
LFLEHRIEQHCQTDFSNFIEIYEAINHELWHLYGLKQTTKDELRYQRFYKAFLHFKYDNLNLAHLWANDYIKLSPYKTHLIDGAIDVLLHLQENYQLHIITNGFKEVQHIKLNESNLNSFFKHVIISEEHGYNKPDIKIFDLAQQITGAQKHECVMIGDNFDADILGALNAKWDAIYLSKNATENLNSKFKHIKMLNELKAIF